MNSNSLKTKVQMNKIQHVNKTTDIFLPSFNMMNNNLGGEITDHLNFPFCTIWHEKNSVSRECENTEVPQTGRGLVPGLLPRCAAYCGASPAPSVKLRALTQHQ